MRTGYVSLIVPCYNVAATLQRFIDSVVNQTYPYIQVITVNDGSTDKTSEILNNNAKTFRDRNIIFTYVYQKNAGLGAAINTGLKHIEGEFLCWADPDDFFMPESIEKRIKELCNHPECGIVTSDAYFFQSDDLMHPVGKVSDGIEHSKDAAQFEYLLKEQSIFCSGCHMVRMDAFDAVNPAHEIYPARRGQNWQLLLPLYYKYSRVFLPEPLYGYIIYPNSMSRGDTSKEQVMSRWDEHETILRQTLQRMQMTAADRDKYLTYVHVRYVKKRFYSSIDFRDSRKMKEHYQTLCNLHEDTNDIRELYRRNRNILCKLIGKVKDVF